MNFRKIFSLKERHKQILILIRDSKLRLFFAMVCMLLTSATRPLIAYLVKPALDDVFIDKNPTMLKLIPLALLGVYIVRGLAMYGDTYLMNYVGQNSIRRLRNRLYVRIQNLPLSFFQKEKTGALMSRVINDVNIVRSMVSNAVTGLLKDFFEIIGLIVVILYHQVWDLAIISFFILPLAFYPVLSIGRRVRRVSTGRQEAMADMSAFLHERFSGVKIVQAFTMEDHEKERFFKKTRKLFRLEMKEVRAKALSSPIMEFLAGLGGAAVIWYGGSKVIQGAYTTGTFISFLAAVFMLYEPVKRLSKLNNEVQRGLAATDRIFDVIERESEISNPPHPVDIKPGAHRVAFEHVDFAYDQDLVLRDINLNVGAGEVVALVGMSGGGKTSLVNLIPRFYDVSRGRILIDNVDIRDASITSLRREIAVVTQEPILFNDTVRNNIAYGNPTATDDDIVRVARAAYAYDFIKSFPKKFETSIGELGSRLSGGEKQRICIARALLKNAPILILDEATSSLDTEAETLVQKALNNLMKGRTTFVIAHRLSTISNANRIVVLVNGRIVEEGTHDQLLLLKGDYFNLHHMQYTSGGPATN